METFSSFLSKEKLNGVGMHSFPWSSVNMSPSVDHPLFIILLCVLSHFSRVRLLATLWTVAHQAPLSLGFSRQEYWSGLPFPTPGDLLDPGIESLSLMSPVLADGFFPTSATWEARIPYECPYFRLINAHWASTACQMLPSLRGRRDIQAKMYLACIR